MTEAAPLTVNLDFARFGDHVRITWGSELFDARSTDFATPYPATALPAVIKALDQLQFSRHSFSETEQAVLERNVSSPFGHGSRRNAVRW